MGNAFARAARAAGVMIGMVATAVKAAGQAAGIATKAVARATAAAAKAPPEVATNVYSAAVSTKPVQAARAVSESPHTGVLWAAWRQGLAELGEAFGKATPDSISVSMPGQIGQPTSQDVWHEKGGRGPHIPE